MNSFMILMSWFGIILVVTILLFAFAYTMGYWGDYMANHPITVCPGWEKVRGPN